MIEGGACFAEYYLFWLVIYVLGRHDERVKTVGCILGIWCLLLAGGCVEKSKASLETSILTQWLGQNCKVQFRRDALGSAHQLPVAATTDSINGAEVSLSGKLLEIGPHGIVVETGAHHRWIPEEAILMIEVSKP